ncbi:MAG: hypothetical protein JKY09_00835 [Crocinitomicaceae bacterium]|nr:hypothetical protein [Crocinitomicaceae bacterium]
MKQLTSLLLFMLMFASTYAQHTNFNTQRNWSLNKKEIMIGFGGTQFLGDLGGRNQIGTDYSLADIDWPSTSLGGMIGYRYRFHPYWATTSSFNISMVRGDDALTNEVIRESRNLHFRSMIFEFQQRIELIVFANEKFGARYSIPGLRGMRNHNEQIYIFTGAGVSYFNPKAQFNGIWTKLRPLSTEGQGLEGGPKKYLPITATIPFGMGMRMGIGRMWRVGIEVTYVKTFSDYIDDVHGVYFDPSILLAEVGVESAYLSNPSQQNSTWFGAGQQRGDRQKDAYFYLNLTVAKNVTYKDYARQRKIHKWKGRYKF